MVNGVRTLGAFLFFLSLSLVPENRNLQKSPEFILSPVALKSCFKNLPMASLANRLIYCSQTGSVFHHIMDLESGTSRLNLIGSKSGADLPGAKEKSRSV